MPLAVRSEPDDDLPLLVVDRVNRQTRNPYERTVFEAGCGFDLLESDRLVEKAFPFDVDHVPDRFLRRALGVGMVGVWSQAVSSGYPSFTTTAVPTTAFGFDMEW